METSHGIGKIHDIFAGRGVTSSQHIANNADGIEQTIEAIASGQGTLVFTNLVDFDMVYGHRNNVDGYAGALAQFDAGLPAIIDADARWRCVGNYCRSRLRPNDARHRSHAGICAADSLFQAVSKWS